MNELGSARANEALRRRFMVEGTAQGGPMLTIASDLFPTFPVSEDQVDAELHWLMGGKLASGFAGIAADAGNQVAVGVLNPTGSGCLVIVKSAKIWTTTASLVFLQAGTAATQTGAGNGFLRDSRGWSATPQRSVGQVVTHTGAFTTQLGRLSTTAALLMVDWSGDIVLIPGQRILFATSEVNRGIDGTFVWRERPAAAYEQLVVG